MNILGKLFSNKIARNASWLILGRVIQMLAGVLIGILTARYLGPSNYGLINYTAAYSAFFTSLCTLGLNSILVKELLDNPDKEGEVLGSALFLRFISSTLSYITILCVIHIVDADDPIVFVVALLNCFSLVINVFDSFNYWFQSKLESKTTAAASLVGYLCTCLYRIILLITEQNILWFAFAATLDYLCVAIILYFNYRKRNGPKLRISKERCRDLLAKGHHFILTGLIVAVYGYTDKFMLKQMLSNEAVGFYTTASTTCSLWCFVLSAIIDSMYPVIVENHQKGTDAFEQSNKQLYAIVIYAATFVSLVITIFASGIINIIYGESFSGSIMPLRILTWQTSFCYLGVARDLWVICEGKQKALKYLYIPSAILNVILNLFLIPIWGSSGAAFASLITQISSILVIPLFIKELRKNVFLILQSLNPRVLTGLISNLLKK